MLRLLFLCLVLFAKALVGKQETQRQQQQRVSHVYFEYGQNLGDHVGGMILAHFESIAGLQVQELGALLGGHGQHQPRNARGASSSSILIVSLGNTSLAKEVASLSGDLPSDSFRLVMTSAKSLAISLEKTSSSSSSSSAFPFLSQFRGAGGGGASSAFVLVANGKPLNMHTHTNVSFNKDVVHYGAVVGAYAALELLGFSFLHPLEPYVPPFLSVQRSCVDAHAAMVASPLSSTTSEVAATVTSLNGKNNDNNNNNNKQNGQSGQARGGGGASPSFTDGCEIDATESPHWAERSFHIHTQHPLELTEVLQGHDVPQFGPHGPHCSSKSESSRRRHERSSKSSSSRLQQSTPEASSQAPHNSSSTSSPRAHAYCERWEDMVKDVNRLFEWAVANRLNKLEWLLLGNYKWGDELETRLRRLRVLTGLGHRFSLMIGADAPIGNIQQHAWHMVNTRLPFKQQAKQIRDRVDWIFSAGFDFLTTESGLSEFTHPECDLMLDLMNEFANYVNGTWGREAGIKVHCSTGQVCEDFPDAQTGDPVNFNFLPSFASPALGIFPHTVQVYALDDPTAGAYGNHNFSYMEEYMVSEAKAGNRSVVFYPETAYWVNVDVDVPLFLPLCAQRRLHDLRRIAGREIDEDFKIHGQMNFDSGWEWGYWLSDVVTARASWNPLLNPLAYAVQQEEQQQQTCSSSDSSTDNDCFNGASTSLPSSYKPKDDQWDAFALSLLPFTKIYGPTIGRRLTSVLVSLAKAQETYLLLGKVNGSESLNLKKLSGFAYMSGGDTWVDLPHMLGLPLLQPDKVHMRETSDKDWQNLLPLLKEMAESFTRIADEMDDVLALGKKKGASISIGSGITIKGSKSSKSSKSSSSNSGGRSSYDHVKGDDKQALDHLYYPLSSGGGEGGGVGGGVGGGGGKMVIATTAGGGKGGSITITGGSLALLEEIDDCIRMLALRATQVHHLYSSKDPLLAPTYKRKAELQAKARAVIHSAAAIVSRREQFYRVPWQRVAAWRDNPTVYRYGYLWAVHSLYYWWRDQGLAEEMSLQSEISPCYLNRMDATEIAVGWGKYMFELLRTAIERYSPFRSGYPLDLVNCFAPPSKEYVFPKDLHVSK